MVDLHRHCEFSTFDGFGKSKDLAEIAKELGHTSLGVTEHGNTNGWVQHYTGCKEVGIKPILGVEGYMLPKYKEKERGYHLCLFAKNAKGYENINTIQYKGEQQKYYSPIWDLEMLDKHSEGVICTTACVAGYLGKCIQADKFDLAQKFLSKLKCIYGEDLYVEIQPYKISEAGLQEKINYYSYKIANKLGIKCILTSDSHYTKKEDFDTYLKMHEIAGHNLDFVEATYKERYLPSQKEIVDRFIIMHTKSLAEHKEFAISGSHKFAKEMICNLEEIEEKIDGDIIGSFTEDLPTFDKTKDSKELLLELVKKGLKKRGKFNKQYIERAKMELDVIYHLNFQDYFLMVQDYIKWAKDRGICVGPGRGSCCNYIVNYALGITEVDSLRFDLEPNRFLMKERNKMPDIDIDFETARRGEVIDYLLEKYKGYSAKICSYGLYKIDNLVNDLAKVCGLQTTKDVDESDVQRNKSEIKSIKAYLNSFMDEGFMDMDSALKSERAKYYNKNYDNIIVHFSKLFKKVRFIGTHAAGVAIARDGILKRTALRLDKNGNIYTNYDLFDMEKVMVIKFDMLGLKTMSEIGECRKIVGVEDFEEDMLVDKAVIAGFNIGKCNGVFQFDKKSVQGLLQKVNASCFEDIVAVSAMNRPGPLTQKMPDLYAANKLKTEEGEDLDESYFDEYLGSTYGTIIYQEQVMKMAVDIGGMSWDEAHYIMKAKLGYERFNDYFEQKYPGYEKGFVKGCKKRGIPEDVAKSTFKKFYNYSFNKGHSVGYSLISVEQMFYKVHHPSVFWFVKMKYAGNDADYYKYCCSAVSDGAIVFLPHVNYSKPKTNLRKVEGEDVLQQGLADLKNVGEKAADFILAERKQNGVFVSYDNFYDRCKSRLVTQRVIDTLKDNGALDFNKKKYLSRVVKYNSTLLAKS